MFVIAYTVILFNRRLIILRIGLIEDIKINCRQMSVSILYFTRYYITNICKLHCLEKDLGVTFDNKLSFQGPIQSKIKYM